MKVLSPSRSRNPIPIAAEGPLRRVASWSARPDIPRVSYLALLLMAFGLLALPFDTLLAGYFHQHQGWNGWKIVLLSEVFAHAWGVGLIGLGFASLVPSQAARVPRLLCASLCAGLIANLGKILVARSRPHSFNLDLSSWESFQGWLPWWTGIYETAASTSILQSFPSAHSATAAGLAWGMSRLCPHGKWYFALLAMLAMLQRLVVEAHYLSDVCWGAAVGVLWANFVFSDSRLGRRFVVLEAWLTRRRKIPNKIS